jgi:hypothetical protein
MPLVDRVGRVVDAAFIGDVEAEELRVQSFLQKLAGRDLPPLLVPGSDDHGEPEPRQLPGDLVADPLVGPRDKRDLAVRVVRHDGFLPGTFGDVHRRL